MSYDIFTTNYLQINSLKKSFQTNLEETHYSNKNSEEKVCTENIWRKITTKN